MDPELGLLSVGGAGPETEAALRNVRAVLEASGASMGDVVRTQVLLRDLDADFEAMNCAYERHFPEEGARPARTTFQAGKLPAGAR